MTVVCLARSVKIAWRCTCIQMHAMQVFLAPRTPKWGSVCEVADRLLSYFFFIRSLSRLRISLSSCVVCTLIHIHSSALPDFYGSPPAGVAVFFLSLSFATALTFFARVLSPSMGADVTRSELILFYFFEKIHSKLDFERVVSFNYRLVYVSSLGDIIGTR